MKLNTNCYQRMVSDIWGSAKPSNLSQFHTFFHNISHSGQVLMSILFTGDLQALVTFQGYQLQEWGQAFHSTQQHHYISCRIQYTGQEEASHLAQTFQHALGEDKELAGILGQPEEVISPAGHCRNVIATDPSL